MMKRLKLNIRGLIRDEVKKGIQESGINEELRLLQLKNDRPLEQVVCAQVIDEQERLVESVKVALDQGNETEVLRLARELAEEKEKSNGCYLSTANKIRTMILAKKDNAKYNAALKAIFNLHNVTEFTFAQYADVHNMRFPVIQAASLTQQYVRRRRMKQIGNVPDRWLSYSKEAGLEFADLVGVSYVESQNNLAIEDVKPQEDIVLKPMVSRGAIGAYIVKRLDEILVPRDQVVLHSWDEMIAHANNLIKKGLISQNAFVLQNAVYADKKRKLLAHDLKIYTFYGEIGCVNEIARDPGLAYWWYTPEHQAIDLKIENPKNVEPIGFKPEHLEIARQLSLKIPSPHMRLDFLVGEDGLYFSEFCSMTGSQVETVAEVKSSYYNQLFGNMYLKAEMCIINDLLQGKQFDEINQFNRKYDALYQR